MDIMAKKKPDADRKETREQSLVEARRARAKAWFETLRDRIVASLEAVEDDAEGSPLYAGETAGRFKRTAWTRAEADGSDGGGGVMSLMTGRVFEKVGCHTSTVHGCFAP
jgi:coproporphyrinogen III oxidase